MYLGYINTVTEVDVVSNNISDLSGIEDFSALKLLRCGANPLATLDVSQNIALENLDATNTLFTSVDLSINTALTFLQFGSGNLSSLDVSNNTALTFLNCSNSQIASIDLSNNLLLEQLACADNPNLTSLDVSQNILLTKLSCDENDSLTELNIKNGYPEQFEFIYADKNPSLICIQVDNPLVFSQNNYIYLDSWATFSEDYGY